MAAPTGSREALMGTAFSLKVPEYALEVGARPLGRVVGSVWGGGE